MRLDNLERNFDLSDEFQFILDFSGKIVKVNPQMCTGLGYEESELLNQEFFFIHPPKRHQDVKTFVERRIKEEVSCLIPLLTKSGEIIPVQTNLAEIQWENTKCWLGISRSFSRLIEIQNTLEVQRDLAIQLSNSMTVQTALRTSLDCLLGLTVVDGGGVYIRDSVSGGYDLLASRNLPDQFVQNVRHYRSISPQAKGIRTGRITHKNPMELAPKMVLALQSINVKNIAILPIRDQEHIGACINLVSRKFITFPPSVLQSFEAMVIQIGDALERISAQENLRSSEHRYQVIMDTIQTGILLIEEKTHKIVEINPKLAQLCGYGREEMIGQICHKFICPNQKNNCPISDGGLSLSEKECILMNRAGEEIPVFKAAKAVTIIDHNYIIESVVDISDRLRAEQQLRASEHKIRQVLDFTLDWEYWRIPSGKLLYISPSCERITGYTPEEFYSHPELITEIVHPVDQHLIQDHKHALDGDGSVIPIEFRILTKTGQIRWIEHVCRAIQGDDGFFLGRRGSNRNISERKEAELKAQATEAKFRKIIEQSPHSIIIYNRQGTIASVNTTFEKIWGVRAMDVVGKFNYHKDTQAKKLGILEKIEEIYAGSHFEQMEYEFDPVLAGVNGRKRFVRGTYYPLKDAEGEIESLVVQNEDITEIHYIQQKLDTSEENFRFVVDSVISNGVYIIDFQGKFLFVNQGFEDITGYSKKEALERPNGFDLIHPEDRLAAEGKICEISQGTIIKQFEFRFIHKNGSFRTILGSFSPMYNATNEVVSLLGVCMDITKQKELQEKELKSQKLESLGKMAGRIAHEFNNNLVVILGNVNLLQMEEGVTPEMLDVLQDVEEAVTKSKQLSSQLLTFSKGGAPILRKESISLFLRNIIPEIMEGKKTQYQITLEDHLPSIEVDRNQLRQVFQNLLTNAEESMEKNPEGSIVICASVIHDDAIHKIKLPSGDYLKITVSDEGSGIPSEHHARIFDPYFSTKPDGVGLGLTTAQSIIRRHGGHISFSSSIDTGTTFEIFLPLSATIGPDTKLHQSKLRQPTKHKRFKGHMLLMDDDPHVHKILTRLLNFLGLTVDSAFTGEEALKMYDDAVKSGKPYSCVIMDLTIPGAMGGEQANALLQQKYPNTRVFVSSGYSNSPILANYQAYGFAGVLAKPFTLEEITSLFNQHCK